MTETAPTAPTFRVVLSATDYATTIAALDAAYVAIATSLGRNRRMLFDAQDSRNSLDADFYRTMITDDTTAQNKVRAARIALQSAPTATPEV